VAARARARASHAFDLERALALDNAFLQPARPFEWAGSTTGRAGMRWKPVRTPAHEHEHEHT
jgi:hypothetical protein